MRHRGAFPWLTVALLGLPTYLLILLLSMWWRGHGDPSWLFTWQTWASWEPWVDAVLLHAGAVFIGWRWWGLARSLWERYGP